jgi:hypothetical protein
MSQSTPTPVPATPAIKSSPSTLRKNIPQSLRAIPHWVTWALVPQQNNNTRFDKVPCQVKQAFGQTQATSIKWSDTSTHLTFDEALATYQQYYDTNILGGIGIILNHDLAPNITCIDIDNLSHKLDQRIPKYAPLEPLLQLAHQTYTELSQSGNGLHIFLNTSLLYDRAQSHILEIYPGNTRPSNAFIAMTGANLLSAHQQYASIVPERLLTLTESPTASYNNELCEPYVIGDNILNLSLSIVSNYNKTNPKPPSYRTEENPYFRMPELVEEGERHNTMNRYLCSLVSQYPTISKERLTSLANKANESRFSPPMDKDELDYLIAHVHTTFKAKLALENTTDTTKFSDESEPEPTTELPPDSPDSPDSPDIPDRIGAWRAFPIAPEAARPRLLDELIYIKNHHKYFDVVDKSILSPEAVNTCFARWFTKKQRATAWLELQPTLKKATDFAWLPTPYDNTPATTAKALITLEHNHYVNAFTYKIKPSYGDTQPWVDLLEHLCPNPAYREALLWYYAYNIQHPDLKCSWNPVMLSIEGAGKDSLIKPISRILPTKYVSSSEFKSPYDDYLHESKFVVINEASGLDKESAAKYKQLTTNEGDRVRTLNLKGKPKVSQIDTCSLIIHSNNLGALQISPNDRRCFVLYAGEILPESQADAYYYWLDHGGAEALFDWLLGFNLSKHAYTPHTLPYKTEYVTMMRESIQSDKEQEILRHVRELDAILPELLVHLLSYHKGDDKHRTVIDVLHSNGWIRWDDWGSNKRIVKKVNGEPKFESSQWYIRKTKAKELASPGMMYDECQNVRAYMKEYKKY